jgi:hypothetical protein
MLGGRGSDKLLVSQKDQIWHTKNKKLVCLLKIHSMAPAKLRDQIFWSPAPSEDTCSVLSSIIYLKNNTRLYNKDTMLIHIV